MPGSTRWNARCTSRRKSGWFQTWCRKARIHRRDAKNAEGRREHCMIIRLDKFRDECGVVAVYAHPEASTLAYLGLHAQQHRGQESAGIAASDGKRLNLHKAMGLVADIFGADALSRVPGSLAIGHTRYSTAGDSAVANAQPIMVACNKGQIALAHNGNIVNALSIRNKLE